MRTKENVRKLVRKQNYRTFKIYGILVLTVAALVATSIIGPTTRNGKVKAFADFAQIDFTAQSFTTRTGVTNNYVIDGGIVPGVLNMAAYVPPAAEHGYRGSVDPCTSIYKLDGTRNGTSGSIPASCQSPVIPDSALNTLDHQWIQGEEEQALIYQLAASNSNAIVFPSIDHNVALYEGVEFTVWGLPSGTPLQPFTPGAPWVEGKLVRIFADGWHDHNLTPGCSQSFRGVSYETDDFASVWSFRDATNTPVNVTFVGILADASVHITPSPTHDETNDLTNCFAEDINGNPGTDFYISHDCEIDGVATSTAVTGCIGAECQPPQLNFCSYTQGKFNDKAKNPVSKYLQANFSNLFPNGLTIGEVGANPLHDATWTNVNNLRTFIATGGTPGVLTGDTTNATSTSTTGGGNLASQVTALTLNIRLSGTMPGDPAGFGNLVICHSGTSLDGQSVSAILVQANKFLASDPTYNLGLSAGSLTALIDNLNRSFDDCTQSTWAMQFLCPPAQP